MAGGRAWGGGTVGALVEGVWCVADGREMLAYPRLSKLSESCHLPVDRDHGPAIPIRRPVSRHVAA